MKYISFILLFIIIFLSCKSPISPDKSTLILAGDKKVAVDNLVHSIEENAKLQAIKSADVSIYGTAELWHYRYQSSASSVYYYLRATIDTVVYDSSSTRIYYGSAFISHEWFDSDSALNLAESNGGDSFRIENHNYIISASLGEPLVPDPSTYWYVKYQLTEDSSQSIFFTIDAVDGTVSIY